MHCVPHLMYHNGHLAVLNIQPCQSRELTYAYRISKTGEYMLIKEWKKCLDICKEVLGSDINGEAGAIFLFAILP